MSRGFCVGTTADVPCPASAKPATDDAASPRNRSKGSDQHEREPLLARHRAHPSSPESSLEVMPLTLRHPYDGVKYRLPMELIALRNGALDSTLRWVYDWDMTTTDVSGEIADPRGEVITVHRCDECGRWEGESPQAGCCPGCGARSGAIPYVARIEGPAE